VSVAVASDEGAAAAPIRGSGGGSIEAGADVGGAGVCATTSACWLTSLPSDLNPN